MPVTAPPIAASTAGAITNGGMAGPASGKLGDGIEARMLPLQYQIWLVRPL